MIDIFTFFDMDTIFFTFYGYPMSYLEFFGTVFTVLCVWFTTRAKVISWPLGIIGTTLYLFLFYQIRLYSDLLEQTYFLISGFIGWWVWYRVGTHGRSEAAAATVGWNSTRTNIAYALGVALCTVMLTWVISHVHLWLPGLFSQPADFPLLDSFTTVLSFAAQWLLVRKKIESWVLWMLVDVIAIGLYWFKDVRFISLEYVLFLFLAAMGFWKWIKMNRASHKTYAHIQATPV